MRVNSLDYSFGFAVRGVNIDPAHEPRYRRFLERLTNDTSGWMHNFGTVLAACYVASGGADFYAVNCGFDHDYAAPALIAAEAGALVTNCDGAPWARGRHDIVIANPKLHPELIKLLAL
jgi:fructose-1,6-bisphosphatase/inositol monophosphatase family enzyme